MNTYKTAKFWKTITYIFTPVIIIPFIVILIVPFIPEMDSDVGELTYNWFLLPFSLGMIATILIASIDMVVRKLIFDKNKVLSTGLFYSKILYFKDVKGYKERTYHIFIEANNNKKIKISKYFEDWLEIKDWLGSNFPNLDIIEKNREEQEILNNQEYGWSAKEREENLAKAKKTAKILNWSGGIIAIVTLLLMNHYKYTILLCVIYPLICLIIIKYYKGLIKIDDRKHTVYPSVLWAIFAPTAVLILRSLIFYKIFDFSNVWHPSIIITLGYLVVLMINNKGQIFYKNEKILSVITMFTFIVFGYAYGSAITLNCVLDESKPEIYKTIVLDKRVSKGRTETYYLKLSPWEKQKEIKEVSVPKNLYDTLKINDQATIKLKKGKLNIPWFEIEN